MGYLLQLTGLHGHIIFTQRSQFMLWPSLGGVHSIGLYQRTITWIHYCIIIQSVLTTLKILCTPPLHPSSLNPPHTQPLATTDLFIITIVLPFPEHHLVGIIQHIVFSDWLLLLSNMYLRFLYVFHHLIAHFFLVQNNTPLSRYTTVCLSIHLQKDILAASKFWKSWIKLIYTSMCRFLCGQEHSV